MIHQECRFADISFHHSLGQTLTKSWVWAGFSSLNPHLAFIGFILCTRAFMILLLSCKVIKDAFFL